MVYGIPTNFLVTKQQICFIVYTYLLFCGSSYISTSLPSTLLEYLNRFKSLVGKLKEALYAVINVIIAR